jgi:hypothetical protein
MRDLLYIVDIWSWFLLVKLVNRTPVWQPASYAMSSAVPALMFFIYMSSGVAVGFSLPMIIADYFQPAVDAFGVVTVSRNIGVLGRLAQVVGVLCGGLCGSSWNRGLESGFFSRCLCISVGQGCGLCAGGSIAGKAVRSEGVMARRAAGRERADTRWRPRAGHFLRGRLSGVSESCPSPGLALGQ